MTNPTNPFNWQMPTASDLVTDLPADFETFGQAVATSMADLLGGTTGQVLSKASNTDMDFTWVAQDDSNAIQNAIVDAKGDLIAASAADTPARLAVGNNGETLVADSSASTGLRYQGTQNAGKNAIINGGMDIWQRGTSFAAAGLGAYSADRWGFYRGGAAGAATWSRQTSGLDNIQYSMRLQRDSGNTSTQYVAIWTALENSDSLRFAGKTVTLSFWAKVGANFSGGGVMTAILNTGTGTNEPPYSFTGAVTAISQTPTVTTSWQRFSYTATLATSARQIAVQLLYYPTGTAGANDWLEVTGVQLELGSVATEFLRNGATIQGELAAASRYYWRVTDADVNANGIVGQMFKYLTTDGMAFIQLPVTMRTTPSSMDTSNIQFMQTNLTNNAIVGPALNFQYSTPQMGAFTFGQTGLANGTQGYAVITANNGFIGFSAEL
jgi:hypothetical protein